MTSVANEALYSFCEEANAVVVYDFVLQNTEIYYPQKKRIGVDESTFVIRLTSIDLLSESENLISPAFIVLLVSVHHIQALTSADQFYFLFSPKIIMDLPDKLGLSSFCNIIMIFINLSIESNEYLTNLFLKWNTIYNYILKFQTNIDFLSGFIKSKISNAHLYKYWNYQRHNAT